MATQPTNQPVPSETPRDLKFNAGRIDEFVTSDSHTYTDRFSQKHRTIAGLNYDANQVMLYYGYITKKSFEQGATLDTPNTVLQLESNGEYYRWDGDWSQPKVVPPGSTPHNAGGVGPGKWVGVGDAALRSEVFVHTREILLSNLIAGIPASITAALDGAIFDAAESELLLSKLHLVSATSPVTLCVSSVTVNSGDLCQVGANENITLSGVTPVETTLKSVAAVTGAEGNFSVTYDLASADGMSVGDLLCLDQVQPARIHFSPGITGVRKPVSGEMMVGFNFMGTLTVSGTNCAVSGVGCPTYLTPGDQVHIQGQTRIIQTVSTSSFTIDSPLGFSPKGLQWWWISKPAAGTVAIAGTAVTGTGTAFTALYDADDLIVVDGRMLRIVSVISETQMTISHNQTVPVGMAHSCFKAGLLHEGAFEITAITGNQVTVVNRSRLRKPPKNLITGGRVRCIKTVLKNTGQGNGFVFSMGAVLQGIKDIALVSPGAGTGLALNGNGSETGYNQQSGQVQLLGCSAVVGWGRGAFLAAGAILVATDQFICGSSGHAVECTDGGDAYLRGARIHGAGGIGLLAAGGFARVSSAAFTGCGLQGVRQDVSSGVYGDTWYTWGNVLHGAMQVNSCSIQLVDSISACNGGDGINAQNSGSGRLTRTLFAGNGIYGMNMTGIVHEATQVWVTGSPASRTGIIASRSRLELGDSAQTGNGANGLYALLSSQVTANNSVQRANGSNGVRADDVGTTVLINSGLREANASGDINQTSGGVVCYDLNPLGTREMGAHLREIIAIADDAVATVFVGNQTIMLSLVSSSSNALQGMVRARVGTSASSALIAGTGLTVMTGALNGTTGGDGNFSISPATDGYLYIENRSGSAKTITIDIMGRIL
ncbi:hypothetical protein [Leclercia adecarboxylata]|uniref:tail fiber/spike domain-containing protein n=1 Tax=Leclercia adecarboxylata TaxID=83655 RepID=UPI0013FD75DD|nr:hypothetical protein G7098_07635 [Leclercia adecarboxylata]